jgi:hypothetical protein
VPAACRAIDASGAKKPRPAKVRDHDDDDDDVDDDQGIRFGLAALCAKLTGGASYSYQTSRQTASSLPVFINRNGTVTTGGMSQSVSANIGFELSKLTSLGIFKTTVSADWSKSTGDGTETGTANLSGWSVGLGGLTVGYTGTLLSFWEGDFLSSASSPGRGATTIVYEVDVDNIDMIAVGLESNLPTSPDAQTGLGNADFSDPVYTARWRREQDGWTWHLSGLVRRADFSASPLLPFFQDTAAVRTGWAVSAGLKAPMSFIAADDTFNTQWTYASDAATYLGISTDLTVYQTVVRSTGPTTGWSGVASYHHVWSEQFESNAFASYVAVKNALLFAQPEFRTFRTGVNLFWKPVDKVKVGIEFGMVEGRFDPRGVLGLFNGAGGRAYSGYLSVGVEL